MRLRRFSQLGWFTCQTIGYLHADLCNIIVRAWLLDTEGDEK